MAAARAEEGDGGGVGRPEGDADQDRQRESILLGPSPVPSFRGMSVLGGYAVFVGVVRVALLYIGLVVAIVCAIDWAVRTRRINPFSRVARFFRGSIDPLLAPI